MKHIKSAILKGEHWASILAAAKNPPKQQSTFFTTANDYSIREIIDRLRHYHFQCDEKIFDGMRRMGWTFICEVKFSAKETYDEYAKTGDLPSIGEDIMA